MSEQQDIQNALNQSIAPAESSLAKTQALIQGVANQTNNSALANTQQGVDESNLAIAAGTANSQSALTQGVNATGAILGNGMTASQASLSAGQQQSDAALANGQLVSASDLQNAQNMSASQLAAQQAANTSTESPFISGGTSAYDAYLGALGLSYQVTPATAAQAAVYGAGTPGKAAVYGAGTPATSAVYGTQLPTAAQAQVGTAAVAPSDWSSSPFATPTNTEYAGNALTTAQIQAVQAGQTIPFQTASGTTSIDAQTLGWGLNSATGQYDPHTAATGGYVNAQGQSISSNTTAAGLPGYTNIYSQGGMTYDTPNNGQYSPTALAADETSAAMKALGYSGSSPTTEAQQQAVSNLTQTSMTNNPAYSSALEAEGFNPLTAMTAGTPASANYQAAVAATPGNFGQVVTPAQAATQGALLSAATPGTPGQLISAATPGTAAVMSTPETSSQIMSQFQNSPGYQNMLTQGINATNANASSQGLLGSGAQGMALDQYAASYAQNAYQAYLTNLSNAAGVGQTAASSLNTANSGLASTAANNTVNLGVQGSQSATSAANQGSSSATSLANQGSSALTSLANQGASSVTSLANQGSSSATSLANQGSSAAVSAGNTAAGVQGQIGSATIGQLSALGQAQANLLANNTAKNIGGIDYVNTGGTGSSG